MTYQYSFVVANPVNYWSKTTVAEWLNLVLPEEREVIAQKFVDNHIAGRHLPLLLSDATMIEKITTKAGLQADIKKAVGALLAPPTSMNSFRNHNNDGPTSSVERRGIQYARLLFFPAPPPPPMSFLPSSLQFSPFFSSLLLQKLPLSLSHLRSVFFFFLEANCIFKRMGVCASRHNRASIPYCR